MQRFGSLQFERLSRFGAAAKLAFVLVVAGLPLAVRAQVPPANDNFASAQDLGQADFGTVTGDNTFATAEAGEPGHAGQKASGSVWYKWTASADALVEFDTLNSSFDTVLAVYIGTNGLTRLNMVVANDDVDTTNPENPAGLPIQTNDPFVKNPYLGPSGVKFNAKRGTTYYIALDGYTKKNSSLGGRGAFSLSWSFNPSGVFRLSSQVYYCSEAESAKPVDGSYGESAQGARITVTRVFGARGKVNAVFSLSDGTAVLGTDYKYPDSTNLLFEDYEMSKSFVIPIIDDAKGWGAAHRNPGRLGGLAQNDRLFNVNLVSVTLDPAEVLDPPVLSPPRIQNAMSSSMVYIYDLDIDPSYFSAAPGLLGPVGGSNSIVNFERAYYRVTESVGNAHIFVYRTGGLDINKQMEIHYLIDPTTTSCPRDNGFFTAAGSDYAAPNINDGPPSLNPDFDDAVSHTSPDPYRTQIDGNAFCARGTLQWAANDEWPKDIIIPIIDDTLPEFAEDIEIVLVYVVGHTIGSTDIQIGDLGFTTVTILPDDYPAGGLDPSFNPDFDISTSPVNNTMPGANNTVYSLVMQANDQAIIGGNFSSYNYTPRYGIARLNKDGSLDLTFDPGQGVPVKDTNANYLVTSLGLTTSGKVVVGGNFNSYNGAARYNIARVNGDGSLDTSFNPGSGANGTVWSVAVLTNDQVLIGGEFTAVNGYPRRHIARLNADGSLDQTFDPGPDGPDGTVYALAAVPDGTLYIGGDFTTVNGLGRRSVALLGTNGLVSTAFTPRVGVDGPVYALALQSNGKLVAGGTFKNVEERSRANIASYNPDGGLDTGFDPGTGADDTVYSLNIQPDGRILLAGLFNSINGTRRMCLARLFTTGEVDTSFMDTAYSQFVGPHKPYWNPYVNPKDFLLTTALQSDGNLMIGGSFHYVGGGRFSSLVQTNDVDNFDGTPYSRAAYRVRYNVARLVGGDTMGPGSMGLLYTNYSVNESAGQAFIKAVRANGTLGQIEATFSIPPRNAGPGVAQAGVDYNYNRVNPRYGTSWSGTRALSDGVIGTNNVASDIFGNAIISGLEDINVPVVHIAGIEGDRSLPFKLDVPSCADVFYLGGQNMPIGSALAHTAATMSILEDDTMAGELSFSATDYDVNEYAVTAWVNLVRSNGFTGPVYVRFATTNGSAISGVDYFGITNTVLFRDGQASTNVSFQVVNDTIIQPTGEKTVNMYLSSPGNGAKLGAITNAVLHIIDDDFLPGRINFSTVSNIFKETDRMAVIKVTRSGGITGVNEMGYYTSNMTAVAGVNYVATNGLLHWDDGDSTPRYIYVPILRDGLVTPDKQFAVVLAVTTNTVPGSPGPRMVAYNTIVNQDAYGQLQFARASYNVREDGGYATITVIRTGGSAETVRANFTTADGTAYAFVNYYPTNGVLAFAPGEISKSFTVRILQDYAQDPAVFGFNLLLSNFYPGSAAGTPANAFVNIIDSYSVTQPPGQLDTAFYSGAGFDRDVYAVDLQSNGTILAGGDFLAANGKPVNRIARLNPDGTLDQTFLTALGGADGVVRALVNQTDDRVLVGGAFTNLNTVPRSSIGRLNIDGSIDTGFNPGSGASGPVFALAETFANGPRKILVGGSFSIYNGTARAGVIRLADDGSVDAGANQGAGANGPVYAIAAYPTNTVYAGKYMVGGDFTTFNGIACNRIARLNADGSLDLAFNAGSGPDAAVSTIAIQPDGNVLIGGTFTNVNGVGLNRIARLKMDGTIDSSFQVGVGANEAVNCIRIQADNRILVGGGFTRASGVTRNRLTRLLSNGLVDPSINFGDGADNYIASMVVQPSDNIILVGGFTKFQGQTKERIARIFGGSVTGSGAFTFSSPNYQVDENGTNVVVTVIRTGGTDSPVPGGTNSILVNFTTADGTAVAGLNYSNASMVLDFPPGETLQNVVIPVMQDQQITPDLTVNLALANPTPPAVLGRQPVALVTIRNVDSAISFSAANYVEPENVVEGYATILVNRVGSTRFPASVIFMTTTNGTAVPGVNYTPVTNTLVFLSGDVQQIARVPIVPTPGVVEGDKTVGLTLTNTSGSLLVAPSAATLTIQDVDQAVGNFMFSQTNYVVGEGDGYALITVVRTNGRSGRVSVSYATIAGDATPGLKYAPTNNTLFFDDGITSQSFTVKILEENQVEGPQTLWLQLTNATGGTSIIGTNPAALTILDDDIGVAFASGVYITSETNSFVTLDLLRLNSTNGTTHVTYATTNGTAKAGVNFVADSRTLTFNPGETRKTISLSLMYDPRVTGDLTFGVVLSNPDNGAQLASPSTANVVVLDVDSGVSFADTNTPPVLTTMLSVLENATNLVLTVVRTNASTGTVQVNYTTMDGTAVAPFDYVAQNGVLVFTNSQLSNTITIPIIDNNLVDGNRSFSVTLFNATAPAQVLAPSNAVVTIIDNDSGFRFSSPTYDVIESGVQAVITVERIGYLDTVSSVIYSTANGTAIAGIDYEAVTGTLVFTNGETSKTFSFKIYDNTIIQGDRTVLIGLSNPSANATLVSPNAASLTIHDDDGSLVIPAGVALTAESFQPADGVIEPGERVTLLFGFRNAGGTNTVNMMATLLATNGVAQPVGADGLTASNSYGVVATGGSVVSRPFTFTANGTNGQRIAATFRLQDSGHVVGTNDTVQFSFTLGTNSVGFTNFAQVEIRDFTNANPYPAILNVSGVDGLIVKSTLTLSNLNHTSPADIDMLLVSPAGQSMLLMANVGGANAISKVGLTFDDAAPTRLTTGQIVSGTYQPSAYLPVASFPAPAPPPPGPSIPYTNALAAFNGSNPNGNWSLYIIDDTYLDSGMLSNGWSMNFTLANPVPAASDVGLTAKVVPSQAVLGSNLVYSLTVTNYGPASASGIVVSNLLPPQATYVSSVAPSGTTVTTNVIGTNLSVLIWSIPTLAKDGYASMTFVAQPTVAGLFTNLATAVSSSVDLNPDNNVAATVSTVVVPSADLALGLSSLPNTVLPGGTVTYLITVTNLGPGTATSVGITNILPYGIDFVSASPAGIVRAGLVGNVICFTNLGTLGMGNSLSVAVTGRGNVDGTFVDYAMCGAAVLDPRKLNNSASVKTVVALPPVMSLVTSSQGLTITWQNDLANFWLEAATNLAAPVWVPVTSPMPATVGTTKTVTIPATNSGNWFFRLHGQVQ